MKTRGDGGRVAGAVLAACFVVGLGLASVAASAHGGSAGTTAAVQKRPNVIVIETDDQTVESMRVMSNVQRLLAAQGTTFDNSFASFPLCCPSRATLLTGQYAHNHTVMGNSPPQGGYQKLDHSNTLAVWLQRAGYYTAHVGKYLNGYGGGGTALQVPPGWSEWHGATSLPYLGFTVNEGGRLVTFPATPANYQTDVWARKGADLIRRRAPSSQPFFMWFAVFAPHSGGPRDPDDPAAGAGRRGAPRRAQAIATPSPAARHRNAFASQALPTPPSFNEADVSDKPLAVRNRPLLTPARIAAVREAYQQRLESLLAVDEAVASLVETLRATGELANTLIIFTSDNGFFHGEHRVANGKVLLYEPSIRVPLLVRGPGVPKGVHRSQLVANVDLAATILDAAHAAADRRLDGRTLFPLLRDGGKEYGRDLLIENGPGGANHFEAIRSRHFLYAEYANGERELYDLARDPDELQSLHNDPRYAAIRTELARRLAHLQRCKGSGCNVRPDGVFTVRSRKVERSGCLRAPLTLRVFGAPAVRSVVFTLNGRRVASDSRRPFRVRPGRVLARARVTATGDRLFTLDAPFRSC
jgi:N-acetylglucosamine-6-sulfatase